jgi:hypothetical protein
MQGAVSARVSDFPSCGAGSFYIPGNRDRFTQLLERSQSFRKDCLPVESIDKILPARHIDADLRLWHFVGVHFGFGFGPLE